MNNLVIFLVGAFAIVALFLFMCWGILALKKTILSKERSNEQDEPKPAEPLPYTAAKLLTRREYAFFKALQPIAQKHSLMICPKIRLADLVSVPQGTKEVKWFNYIKAKHVDFTLCDMDLKVKLIIELDDSTHDRPDRQTRDDFIDRVFQQINVKLLHVRQWGDDLEAVIVEALNITPTCVSPKTL